MDLEEALKKIEELTAEVTAAESKIKEAARKRDDYKQQLDSLGKTTVSKEDYDKIAAEAEERLKKAGEYETLKTQAEARAAQREAEATQREEMAKSYYLRLALGNEATKLGVHADAIDIAQGYLERHFTVEVKDGQFELTSKVDGQAGIPDAIKHLRDNTPGLARLFEAENKAAGSDVPGQPQGSQPKPDDNFKGATFY